MIISQKQANLLANEIFERLKKENKFSLDPAMVAKIKAFKKYRDKLYDDKEKIQKEIDDHDKQLTAIVGKKHISKIRGYWDEENIIQKLEEANTPSITEIEDKILLKSMFASADDMEAFVDSLVKEYTKKKATAK